MALIRVMHMRTIYADIPHFKSNYLIELRHSFQLELDLFIGNYLVKSVT